MNNRCSHQRLRVGFLLPLPGAASGVSPGSTRPYFPRTATAGDGSGSMTYLYWPVSGSAVFWNEPYSAREAKAAARELRERGWPSAEIERVLLLNNNARRYWRWRGGRWSTKFWTDPTPKDLARWA